MEYGPLQQAWDLSCEVCKCRFYIEMFWRPKAVGSSLFSGHLTLLSVTMIIITIIMIIINT